MSNADGPDMDNRDPKDLNTHVKVAFEEVLGEPDAVRSMNCVWKNSYCCFNGTLNCCYKTLTVLCGIPLAFCWACEFACISFQQIWCVTPKIKAYSICLYSTRKILTMMLEALVGPCCETCGLIFSKITVKTEQH